MTVGRLFAVLSVLDVTLTIGFTPSLGCSNNLGLVTFIEIVFFPDQRTKDLQWVNLTLFAFKWVGLGHNTSVRMRSTFDSSAFVSR
jgi:hypothetical protein